MNFSVPSSGKTQKKKTFDVDSLKFPMSTFQLVSLEPELVSTLSRPVTVFQYTYCQLAHIPLCSETSLLEVINMERVNVPYTLLPCIPPLICC